MSPRAQLVKNCFVIAASYPFFIGIRGNVTHFFRAWGNTTHFQNELKETLAIKISVGPLITYMSMFCRANVLYNSTELYDRLQ